MMMIMRSRLKSSFAIHPTCCSLHANMQFTRPRCGCRCECSRRPNRRIPCTICHHLIGPGCCATDHEIGAPTVICHRCSEANPQEVDGATVATTELCEAGHGLSCSDTGCDGTTFDFFDTNGSGSIDLEEVKVAMHSLGFEAKHK